MRYLLLERGDGAVRVESLNDHVQRLHLHNAAMASHDPIGDLLLMSRTLLGRLVGALLADERLHLEAGSTP